MHNDMIRVVVAQFNLEERTRHISKNCYYLLVQIYIYIYFKMICKKSL